MLQGKKREDAMGQDLYWFLKNIRIVEDDLFNEKRFQENMLIFVPEL